MVGEVADLGVNPMGLRGGDMSIVRVGDANTRARQAGRSESCGHTQFYINEVKSCDFISSSQMRRAICELSQRTWLEASYLIIFVLGP